MEGWISLNRSIQNHWLWKDEKKLKWWLYLLLTVNHSEQKVVMGNNLVKCGRGQCIKSLDTHAKNLNTTKKTVSTFFKLLEKDGMLKVENLKITTRITICNYDTYQGEVNGLETVGKRLVNDTETASKRPLPSNNNVNNENNENNVKEELELFSENEKAGKVKEFDYKTTLISKLKKEDFKTDSEKQYFEITKAFYDLIIETQKQLSISTAKIERSNGKWIDSIRLILTDDKHTLKDLQDVFKVVRDDAFWKGKVLSTSKLRIQMDKLLIESRKNGNKTSIRKPKEGCTYEELAQTLSNRFD